MSRIIAIGDVHGCLDELNDLLECVSPTPQDRIIFLGDLINRGPNSSGVLKRVRSMPNAISILGNHELRLLRYDRTQDTGSLRDSDKKTIKGLNKKDWQFLRYNLIPYYYAPEYETVFVHGGFAPGKPWYKQSAKTMCRTQVITPEGKAATRRECPGGTPWFDLWQGPPFVVYGHFRRSEVVEREHSIGIDTACIDGVQLTAYILPEKKIVQVPARKSYR